MSETTYTLHWSPLVPIEVSEPEANPVQELPAAAGWYIILGYHDVYSPVVKGIEDGPELLEHAVPLYIGLSTNIQDRLSKHLGHSVNNRERIWVAYARYEADMGPLETTLTTVEKVLIWNLAPALNAQGVQLAESAERVAKQSYVWVQSRKLSADGLCLGLGGPDQWFPRGKNYSELGAHVGPLVKTTGIDGSMGVAIND